jgi:hypothetical protein
LVAHFEGSAERLRAVRAGRGDGFPDLMCATAAQKRAALTRPESAFVAQLLGHLIALPGRYRRIRKLTACGQRNSDIPPVRDCRHIHYCGHLRVQFELGNGQPVDDLADSPLRKLMRWLMLSCAPTFDYAAIEKKTEARGRRETGS